MIRLLSLPLLHGTRHIVNYCIATNTFLECWTKTAVFILVKKQNEVKYPKHCTDLRPTNILPAMSKNIKVIAEQ